MNRKRKTQLLFLGVFFCMLLASFAALKMYKAGAQESEKTDEESYPVMQIDPAQVKEIGIINGTESINLLRTGEEWKCLEDENVVIDSEAVARFLEQASNITSDIRIEQVEDMAQYGLEQPRLNVTFQWEDNMYTLKVGDFNSVISRFYISLNDEKMVYTAENALYNALNKTLDDFKQINVEGAEALE
ncbi:MAG: DUF4340 domain-containing protein [Lachnospiraceae bacterium]|nr:DUF4340 domain-containing protein [Lachnospiraceae bacterium]MDE6185212.1 DUF4340 domain-containing protein [Lachnospiraceae bacterium]